MQYVGHTLFAIFFSLFICGLSAAEGITNYQTEGNLESTIDVGCVELDTLSNKNTPADLYKGISKCLIEENYKRAAELFALAGVYADFDTLRVRDKSAHQAITVLQRNAFQSVKLETKKALLAHINMTSDRTTNEFHIMCKNIIKLGAPSYYPRYMIQHGIEAFKPNSTESAINVDFNVSSAWRDSLTNYLHCPES